MRAAVVLAAVSFTLALPLQAAVDLEQKPNVHDRFFERLPDLRLVRGATPKTTQLVVTAEPDEAWTITTTTSEGGDWMEVTPSSGTGPAEVVLRFDAAVLNTLEDPTGSITITSAVDPETNTETLAVNWNIWPNLVTFDGGGTRAELIAYAKDPANWPLDGFGGSYELWGFLPDAVTHGDGAGANMDAWERTPCAPGVTDRDDCVREGQAGLAGGQSADQAWLLSTGDPRVVIGVLDSGIRWDERNLATKHYLNARELGACAPPGAVLSEKDPFDVFDVNDDGVFNIRDYDNATWLTDVNGNGFRDPQDLIWGTNEDGTPCSDGTDADGNGYTDDISGWDFYWNDNDPSDDANFGHGTGEANDSTAEAHDGGGTPGVCPRCLVLNVRVGDSFVVDVNQFADGVIFTVESGAQVVQEALGSLNNTPYAQAAIEWAYDNGVPVIASAADETSYHHNMPGALEHTIYVHAITFDDDGSTDPETASTFLNFNNCTNFGGHLSLSTPGSGCSSEATGKTAGQTGLLMSHFLQERDRANGAGGTPEDRAYFAEPLSAEEVYQVLVASADDIDVPGAEADPQALELRKFPSNEGWDLHFGYGRNNARRSLELIRDRAIPPEADVTSPRWFEVFDPQRTPSFEVKGTVQSHGRAEDLTWELHVAEGPVGTSFVKIAQGEGPVGGDEPAVLGSVDLSAAGPLAALVARAADQASGDPEQFSATLELRVFGKSTATGADVRGIFRKTFGVRADPTTHEGFPIYLGASGESSPKLTDVDGDGREEIVMATADGLIHAIDATGAELPGFPAALATYAPLSDEVCAATPAKCHRDARPFATGAIDAAGIRQSIISSLAVGDLDGDGGVCRDIVTATTDGLVFAVTCAGEIVDGFPVEVDRTKLSDGLQGARRCTDPETGAELIGCRSSQQHGESGFFSSPVLVDLDQDGDLEIVAGGLDSWVYAWHHDGAEVNGFPVHLDHPTVPAFNADGSINRFIDRIISSPTVADVFGDGTPVLFFGTNERIQDNNGAFLYAVWPDGNAHPGGAFPPGWPTRVTGFIPGEILPFVGRGNPNSPAAADLDGDGDDEVINAGMGGTMTAFDATGDVALAGGQPMQMKFSREAYGEETNTDEELSLPVINNPSVADLDGDGLLEIINGTAGSGLIAVASAGGLRSEFDHSVSAWVAGSGFFQAGFPQKVADYQFFMNYAVADLEGTGRFNVISGDGGYFVWAPNVDGKTAPGFPKWAQGWHITTPALGDLDGDELIDVVIANREGWLWAWKTGGHVGGPADAPVPAIQWEGFHHDDHNTGNANPATLKAYPKLLPPGDGCGDGCCCSATGNEGGSSPLAGALALAALVGTIVVGRRRRNA